MNKLNILTIILLFSSISVNAEIFLPKKYIKNGPFSIGSIIAISGTKLSFSDRFYDLSPTVKFSTADDEKASVRSFKKGDFIAIKMIKINKKRYVDHVYKMYKR